MNDLKRETVIRVGESTHGFVLPEGHALEETEPNEQGRPRIRLSVPGARGETFVVIDRQETDEEIRYHLGTTGITSAVGEQPADYPWLELMNREQERLRQELLDLGAPVNADAWGQGEGHEEHYARTRANVRRLRGERAAG